MLHILFRHADPRVLHFDIYGTSLVAAGAQNDLISLRRIFGSIVDENAHRLFEKAGIAGEEDLVLRGLVAVQVVFVNHERFFIDFLYHLIE